MEYRKKGKRGRILRKVWIERKGGKEEYLVKYR